MRIVRWCTGSWLSRVYLVVVVMVIAWSLWGILTWDEPDASFAVVWPVLLTMPLSLPLVMWAPDGWAGLSLFTVCVAVCALVNAAALNGFIGRVHRSRRAPVHPGRR